MIIEQSEHIICEVGKAFMGKDDIVRKVLMTIYAGGHILLEDCPGVGKTTLSRCLCGLIRDRLGRSDWMAGI